MTIIAIMYHIGTLANLLLFRKELITDAIWCALQEYIDHCGLLISYGVGDVCPICISIITCSTVDTSSANLELQQIILRSNEFFVTMETQNVNEVYVSTNIYIVCLGDLGMFSYFDEYPICEIWV